MIGVLKKIIDDSEILRYFLFLKMWMIEENITLVNSSSENDTNWPRADKNGRQELEIKMGKTHISFSVK